MPKLVREKDEDMAQLLARGFDYTTAHVKAGFQKNTGNAHSKANTPDMVARVIELKEELGIEEGRRKELIDTDAEDIDEEWLIDKYREYADAAAAMDDYKAAKLCLDEIGKMKTLGDQNVKANNSKALDVKNDANIIAAPPAINLQIFNQGLERFTGGTGDSADDAKDITPREDEVGGSDDQALGDQRTDKSD